MLILPCLAEMLETHVDSFDLRWDGFLHLLGDHSRTPFRTFHSLQRSCWQKQWLSNSCCVWIFLKLRTMETFQWTQVLLDDFRWKLGMIFSFNMLFLLICCVIIYIYIFSFFFPSVFFLNQAHSTIKRTFESEPLPTMGSYDRLEVSMKGFIFIPP